MLLFFNYYTNKGVNMDRMTTIVHQEQGVRYYSNEISRTQHGKYTHTRDD